MMKFPKPFLRKESKSLLAHYKAIMLYAIGTGIASVLSYPSADTPPILEAFYNVFPITVWGLFYIITGVVLIVGLYIYNVARWGLVAAAWLLLMRLAWQMWQFYFIWREAEVDNDSWWAWWDKLREVSPSGAGLPILAALVLSTRALLMGPFSNPDDSTEVDAVRVTNGNGDDK